MPDRTLYDSQDHTPGYAPRIPSSPFKSAEALARRLSADGGLWEVQLQVYDGDHGYCIDQAVEKTTRVTVNLWRDAEGGWWIQRRMGHMGWLPDVDRTLALVWPGKNEIDDACGNEVESNVTSARYGMW